MSESSPFVDFRALKGAVSMERVLDHYGLLGRLARDRDVLAGPCPIRKGGGARFVASLAKNSWNCASDCGCGGSVIDLVARMEGIDLQAGALRMVEWFKLDLAKLNQAPPEAAASRPSSAAPVAAKAGTERAEAGDKGEPSPPPEAGCNRPLAFRLELDARHPYLAERGLSPETAEEFGMGGCARGVMAGRIAIPIANPAGQLVGYAGRWPGEPPDGRPKYRLPDGFRKSAEVYRLAQASKEPAEAPWVIVAGFFDAARFWQLGIRKCVALMGTSLSPAQESLLVMHLTPDSHVVVVFDEDEAGREGRGDIVRRLAARAFVRFVAFDAEGFKAEHLPAQAAAELGLIPARP